MDLLQIALGMGIANTIAEDEKKKRERNIIEIPENATNGDVIKALFPNMDFYDPKFPSVKITISDGNGHRFGNLDSDWWNAPYKRETE